MSLRSLIYNKFQVNVCCCSWRGRKPHFENQLLSQLSCSGLPPAHRAHSCHRDFALALPTACKTLTSEDSIACSLISVTCHILSEIVLDSIKKSHPTPSVPYPPSSLHFAHLMEHLVPFAVLHVLCFNNLCASRNETISSRRQSCLICSLQYLCPLE